jgi:hypothetical protein
MRKTQFGDWPNMNAVTHALKPLISFGKHWSNLVYSNPNPPQRSPPKMNQPTNPPAALIEIARILLEFEIERRQKQRAAAESPADSDDQPQEVKPNEQK